MGTPDGAFSSLKIPTFAGTGLNVSSGWFHGLAPSVDKALHNVRHQLGPMMQLYLSNPLYLKRSGT
jgi:hypothetical protein